MITGNHEKIAFDVTKEIVIARLSNCQHAVDKEHGEKVADYFETIYNRILEIFNSEEN